jgi:hypothetical protein
VVVAEELGQFDAADAIALSDSNFKQPAIANNSSPPAAKRWGGEITVHDSVFSPHVSREVSRSSRRDDLTWLM